MAQAVYSLGCWLDGRCSVPGRGKACFFFSLACGLVLESSQWATEAVSLGLKRPGREVDHLYLASVRLILGAQLSTNHCALKSSRTEFRLTTQI
jgi:hypothetical protein